jgi:hypothetical protein
MKEENPGRWTTTPLSGCSNVIDESRRLERIMTSGEENHDRTSDVALDL